MIKAFNNVVGKDVSTWTRNTSQELVDTRVPENNWIDGVYDMIQSLKKTAIKLELLQVIHEKGIAIS